MPKGTPSLAFNAGIRPILHRRLLGGLRMRFLPPGLHHPRLALAGGSPRSFRVIAFSYRAILYRILRGLSIRNAKERLNSAQERRVRSTTFAPDGSFRPFGAPPSRREAPCICFAYKSVMLIYISIAEETPPSGREVPSKARRKESAGTALGHAHSAVPSPGPKTGARRHDRSRRLVV